MTRYTNTSFIIEITSNRDTSPCFQVQLPKITIIAGLAGTIVQASEAVVGTHLTSLCFSVENCPWTTSGSIAASIRRPLHNKSWITGSTIGVVEAGGTRRNTLGTDCHEALKIPFHWLAAESIVVYFPKISC